MGSSSVERDSAPISPLSGGLPARLRLLCVASVEPSWINLTLQLDAVGCHEPQFRWASDANAALSLMRNESFDCVLIGETPSDKSPRARQVEDLELLRAVRASGCSDPVVLIASQLDDDVWLQVFEVDCAVLATQRLWESRALVPAIQREIARVELAQDNHKLTVAHRRRLGRERDEADHLLNQQRRMLQDLNVLAASSRKLSDESAKAHADPEAVSPPLVLPPEIREFYTDLIRTYVIMGSGSLRTEIAQLAELITLTGLSTRETLELHVERVAALVEGLGNRSSRHVMARADLLALELMIHVGDCYHRESLRTSSAAVPIDANRPSEKTAA
ncbi:MAG: hypothetical protein IID45_00345 [Planctomycetes bacterium]|nr:hypothetical protein [Planctomycetota bacterium]